MGWSIYHHDGRPWTGSAMAPIRPVYRGPADPSKGVRIRMAPAMRLDWRHDGSDDDIVAYEIWEPDASSYRERG